MARAFVLKEEKKGKEGRKERKWCDRICMNKHLADHSNRSFFCFLLLLLLPLLPAAPPL